MMNTDYPFAALEFLLDESCLTERFFPLIPHKAELLRGLQLLGCKTKSDAEHLSDEGLLRAGLNDPGLFPLFRRFLTLYDVKPQKLREIDKVASDPEERAAFRELYCLPGVKQVRASLYYRSGYRSLKDFTDADPEEIIARTAATISANGLSCVPPLPKEARTHIAVAKAFTLDT